MGNEPAGGGSSDESNLFRPDTVISPAQPGTPSPAVSPQMAQPSTPGPMPQPEHLIQPELLSPQAASAAQPASTNYYTSAEATDPQLASNPGVVTWTASEYIAHSKSSNWYIMLGVAAVVIAALVWLFTRDLFATATVIVAVILLSVYAGRQPRQETYTLDDQGLSIGNRHYGFQEFRSFAIASDGAFHSIELTPTKRFAMYTTVYFDPVDEDRIADILSLHLPMEETQENFADSLMRRIHF